VQARRGRHVLGERARKGDPGRRAASRRRLVLREMSAGALQKHEDRAPTCSVGGRLKSRSAVMSVLLSWWQNATSLLANVEK
jgi:hypothetical protein